MIDSRTLLRSDLLAFVGYRSARSGESGGDVWLNANESAWPNGADPDATCRRYPEPQPVELVAALGSLYECAPDQLLVGRGSDEAIDLLIRACCMPGGDAIVVTPPVFGMYAVAARLHGVKVVEVPLNDGPADFEVDLDLIAKRALDSRARIVFLCSPGNPAGGEIAAERVARLARTLEAHAFVVVDEAYVEYADAPSLARWVPRMQNLVVLRTLSKAHALAAARIGCAIGDPGLITALRRCQAPYPIPGPSAAIALEALRPKALAQTRQRAELVRSERTRVATELVAMPGVRRVYPSSTNFLLARFDDADAACTRLLAEGIVVRDMRAMPQLGDALRITLGTRTQNNRLLAVLARASLAA